MRGLWQRTLADGTIVYDARLRIDGQDKRVPLEARTKTDAIREAESLRVDRDRGEQRHGSLSPTLAELADEWLEHMQARVAISDQRRRYSQRTVDMYRQRLDAHVLDRLGGRRADELRVDDLRKLIDRLTRRGLAPSTVTSAVNILGGLLRFGVKRGQVPSNVVRDLDRDDRPGVKRQSEPRYLTGAELERLLAAMGDVFRPVAATCAFAGLRVSEALGLRWRDVDFDADRLTVAGQLGEKGEWLPVTKTEGSATSVPILPALRRELRAHRSRVASRSLARVRADSLVFTSSSGRPHSRKNVLRAVWAAGDAAGLNPEGAQRVGVHDLRHSLVAIAFESGLTAPEVAELARHASPRVTLEIYAGLTSEGRERAVAKLANAGFGA